MKEVILILFIFSLTIFATQADKKEATSSKYNFRKTIWGMSQKEVRLKEKAKPQYITKKILGYSNKSIVNLSSSIVYIFSKNKLVRSKYIIQEHHSNKNTYISDFNTLKNKLTKKYGKPKENKVFWINDLYKDKYQDWGFAISLGHLSYYTIWETKDTIILLILTGENYNIDFQIEYSSKKLKILEKKENNQKDMEDL